MRRPTLPARQPVSQATRFGRIWFAASLWLFAAALPVGAALALLGPVAFIRLLGTLACAGALLGIAVSFAGVRVSRTDARVLAVEPREPVLRAALLGAEPALDEPLVSSSWSS